MPRSKTRTIERELAGGIGRIEIAKDGTRTITLPEAHWEALRQPWKDWFPNEDHGEEAVLLDELINELD